MSEKIAIIGLGYVGLPLAVEFAKKGDVVGFDVSMTRLDELRRGEDRTRETSPEELAAATGLMLTADPSDLVDCTTFIVTVPTPVDSANLPDLTAMKSATRMVAGVIGRGSLVIYESTVYPGCTEEVCVPLLAELSGLTYNQDFFCGYSPERINPGDKEHTLTRIMKLTSGSTPEAAERVDSLYRTIITAGTFRTSSIRVAEAAKVIENTQRDVNIGLMNELSVLFTRLGLDTREVLEAAGTKWNFLKFQPGLVGGHCIGVDPYYLTYKAQEIGFHPEIILSGRRINDSMADYYAGRVVKVMINSGKTIRGGAVLVLGATFKENCPDVRNSKVFRLVNALREYSLEVDLYDPFAEAGDLTREAGYTGLPHLPDEARYDAIILAVPHRHFLDLNLVALATKLGENPILFDLKSALPTSGDIVRL